MKRLFRPVVLALLIAVLLVSCKTVDSQADLTDEQYDYALHLVLDQAQEQAISDLFKQLNEFREPMIPSQYSGIEETKGRAPGLEHLVKQWFEVSSLAVLQLFGYFSDYAGTIKDRIVFRDPRSLAEAGDTSISLYYRSLFRDELLEVIYDSIHDWDYSVWTQCVIQYNAWAATRNLLYNEDNDTLDATTDIDKLARLFSEHLTERFFEHLGTAEALIRTTPDPDMDPVLAVVLGLV